MECTIEEKKIVCLKSESEGGKKAEEEEAGLSMGAMGAIIVISIGFAVFGGGFAYFLTRYKKKAPI